jgi:hypothetical protein
MNTQIFIKQRQSLFGDAAHCPSIILFIPLILSRFRRAASINGMVTAEDRHLRSLRSRRDFLIRVAAASCVFMLFASTVRGAASTVDFSRDILPILSDKCYQCHGPDENKRKAKLRLDVKESAFRVKDGVAVIRAGNSAQSEVYRRISSTDPDEVMPPPKSNRQLTPAQIVLLQRWIDEGARWGGHWAFEKPSASEPPPLRQWASRVINPIDRFVLARLEQEGLAPSPEAPKEALIRRATLDLTGLPPSLQAVDAFVSDGSPGAYERLVERLLQSPSFGERMAWDWLDAARYADSNGYQGDSDRTMWPWRDWVVEAFNRNLPYDEFTIAQLAGDLLPDATPEQKLATGFARNHPINGEGGRIAEENRVDYVMDMMETTGTVWLGLTMNCCRCHDHKFDPLTRRDYYNFFAFFNQTPITGGGGDPQTKPVLEISNEAQREQLTKADEEIQRHTKALEDLEKKMSSSTEEQGTASSEGKVVLSEKIQAIFKTRLTRRTPEQLNTLEKEFEKSSPEYAAGVKTFRESKDRRDRMARSIPKVMVMEEMPKPRKTFMLDKGIYDKPGEEVSADVPAALPRLPANAPKNRLGLAEWLVAPQNPLMARVTVNRLWQQFFGVGLVKTPENLGVQAEFPVHPELLDWLAAEFVRSGWNVKDLCRLIVTSATYRQSSKVTPELFERDSENRLLARAPRFRMPSWMIRDQALAASGLLAARMGGPPVKPYQPAGVWEEATFGNKKYQQDKGESLYRRSLYVFWRRIVGPTMFFDTASRATCTVKLPRTNTPLHALTTLNDVTYVEAARNLAERVIRAAGGSSDARVELAFRLVLARRPAAAEKQVLEASVERLKREFAAHPDRAKQFLSLGESKPNAAIDPMELAAYAGLCLTILNLDEALTKE